MRTSIFSRIFIIYTAILLISVLFIEFYIARTLRSSYISNLISNLSVQAKLIAGKTDFDSNGRLDEFCRKLKKTTGARITVLDHKGDVLGDSDNDSSMMDNRSDRPEIIQARISQKGWSARLSQTVKEEYLYLAERITVDGNIKGFIRLAIPLREVNEAINMLRLKINLIVIMIFILMVGILFWHTEKIRKFLMHIAEYSGALASGLFGKRIYLKDSGVFTELSENLNNMASSLQSNIEKSTEETNRLNVILKNIPEALIIIDSEGIIERSNTIARELFNNQALEGNPYIEIIRSPQFISLVDSVTEKQMPVSAELTIDSPAERHLSVRVSPLFYRAGEFEGTVAIFHDITHVRKLEQMRRDFVANVSHEIKTPVTSIKGFAETLLDGAMLDKDHAEKFLKTIKHQSERLDRLVEDLLTLSKIELGKVKIHKTETGLQEIISSVMDSFIIQAAGKNILLKRSFNEGEVISADRDRLMQILVNLVDNAMKFSDKGEVEIGVSADRDGKYLFVKDSGIGIPSNCLGRLGERFFRVDPSRSRDLGGTGLGLAIVKHLVKAHEWKMKIESVSGKGTNVKIYYS